MTKNEIKDKLEDFINKERLDEKSKRTLVDYRTDVNKLIDFLQDEFEITKDLLLEFKEYLNQKDFSIKSKNKYFHYIGYDLTLKKYKEQQKSSLDDPIWEQEH